MCTRDDIIFEKKQNISCMQAIFRGAYLLRFSQLQCEDKREKFSLASTALKVIARMCLPIMDGKVIINFAYDFLLFKYTLFFYFVSK